MTLRYAKTAFIIWLLSVHNPILNGQASSWQQEVAYFISVNMDVQKHQFSGIQYTTLYNHSPDTLDELHFHLYYNAFQPGSDMDVRSRQLPDPDPRVGARISQLKPHENGWVDVKAVRQEGQILDYSVSGTLLSVSLKRACLPGDSVRIELNFRSQIPIQIRRTGRNNREGIDYSMAQWYPKLCQYDKRGWHTDPYIAREFYGIFGNFQVQIEIDSSYCLAHTGILQNPGIGPCNKPLPLNSGNKRTWVIRAEKVHDFVWVADPDFVKADYHRSNGCILEAFYLSDPSFKSSWSQLLPIMDSAFRFIEAHYGEYPYPKYAFIQGGDGGMEYPMATLITGKRPLNSLVGVATHELLHSWYHGVVATHEGMYPWMDEGFTSFVESETINHLRGLRLVPGQLEDDPHRANLEAFAKFAEQGEADPLCTHADHFKTNRAYGMGAYSKGALCLHQLSYLMGRKTFLQGMLRYYQQWKFKHPEPEDFFRTMEKTSGLELDWFDNYFVHTTKRIDYAIDSLDEVNGSVRCHLSRRGEFPMPVEILVLKNDGTAIRYYIPLNLMRGGKQFPKESQVHTLTAWSWVNPHYMLQLDCRPEDVAAICLNPERQLADTDPSNDCYFTHSE